MERSQGEDAGFALPPLAFRLIYLYTCLRIACVGRGTMSNDLIMAGQQHFLPVLSVADAVQRRCAIIEFVQRVMKPGVDFGTIPGTVKPTLLKPGAEKLCTLFGLTSRFQILEKVEDWMGEAHDGEPFFYYLYHCQLWRDALLIAEGDGSCNSFEQKYRYREAHRVCPACGKPAIVKGKAEYGGGWLCFVKRGGCGAKYPDGDESIEGQPVGRIVNVDIADVVNTIQKMAQKRSLIAATLLAVNASEFFTQDVEDTLTEAEAASAGESAITTAGSETVPATEEPAPVRYATAAEARAAFETKVRRFATGLDKTAIGKLAVALLGGKHERWTAEVWQKALDRPDADWRAALEKVRQEQAAR